MPWSSNARIRLASEYRGGGSVKCCSGRSASRATGSPAFSGGRRRSRSAPLSSFLSSRPSS